MKKFILFNLLLSMVFALSACGTYTPVEEELFDELAKYTNSEGEIVFSSSINSSSAAAKSVAGKIMFETFHTTTPKGKLVEGLVVFEANNSPLVTKENFRFRGKISSIQGKKVFSGFMIDKAGNPFPFMAYKPGTSFDQSLDGSNVVISEEFKKAHFFKQESAPYTPMVARNQNTIILGIISEDLGLKTGLTEQPASLDLTVQIDGFLPTGETAVTVPGFGTLKISIIGLLNCGKASGLQECTISK